MMDNKYLIEKQRSESPEDLIGKLLFRLTQLQNAGNQGLNGLNDRQFGRHNQLLEYLDAGLKQGKTMEQLVSEVKRAIDMKKIDLSEVVKGLSRVDSSIQKGSNKVVDRMDTLPFEIPETKVILQEIAKSIKNNKPEKIVFDKVIESQNKGNLYLSKLLIALAGEIRKKDFPKAMAISGPVEVEKPGWWKDWSFSWEPLKKILEDIKSHTFSVKVENQREKRELIDYDEIVKKIGKEFRKAVESMPRSVGMGGPFAFSTDGKLITTNSDYIFNNILDGRKTVTTAGTRVQLAADTAVSKVVITAMIANTDYVVVGGSTVVAAEATRRGIPLVAGQSMEMSISNLDKIYLDSVVSGEGVTFVYF